MDKLTSGAARLLGAMDEQSKDFLDELKAFSAWIDIKVVVHADNDCVEVTRTVFPSIELEDELEANEKERAVYPFPGKEG